jgi:hypothetical protein
MALITFIIKAGRISMWRLLIASCSAVFVLGLASSTVSQEIEPVMKVMALKLDYSQKVLESIVKEEFDELEDLSFRLMVLTGTEDWKVIRTEEYNRHTADFVSAVEAFRKARDHKDIDESTKAYIDMTLSCVQCHKYVHEYRDALIK